MPEHSLIFYIIQIQPDMIALDPDFIGSLAPEPKLTTTGGVALDIPFARLPRLERLRIQGKADESETVEALADGEGEDEGDTKEAREDNDIITSCKYQ